MSSIPLACSFSICFAAHCKGDKFHAATGSGHACTVQDKECKASKVFGEADSGVLASWPGADFDLSQIYNKTESAMKSDGFSMSTFLNSFVGEATPASSSANATASSDTSDEASPDSADGLSDSNDANGQADSDSADGSTASIEARL